MKLFADTNVRKSAPVVKEPGIQFNTVFKGGPRGGVYKVWSEEAREAAREARHKSGQKGWTKGEDDNGHTYSKTVSEDKSSSAIKEAEDHLASKGYVKEKDAPDDGASHWQHKDDESDRRVVDTNQEKSGGPVDVGIRQYAAD